MSKQSKIHQAVITRDYYYRLSRKFAYDFTYCHPHGWRKMWQMGRSQRRDIYGAAGPAYFGATKKTSSYSPGIAKNIERRLRIRVSRRCYLGKDREKAIN